MFNKNTKKGAFLSSLVALVLCCSMFVGTTFAWFTDEVVSENNIIKSGTLDVEMYYGDSADAITNDASKGAIFDYQYWEPGYTQTKYVKIQNAGDLAFKFQLNILPAATPVVGTPNLADVIDVYMFDVDAEVTRDTIAAASPVGTLSELMADTDGAAYGILLPAQGKGSDNYTGIEAPRGEISYCIVLKMQESAGNEYQNLTIGGEDGFKVQLLANQYTWENDSFDHTYDEDSEFAPKANVINTGMQVVTVADPSALTDRTKDSELLLNASFQFQPTETYEQALESEYQYYHADYVVYADADIPGNSVTLAGFYQAYADFLGADVWIPMTSDSVIDAGTQIRLVEALGVTVNYEEICKWGNDGTGFLCGIADNSNGALDGVTLTVELRLYETTGDPDTTTGPKNEETGEHITIGTYKYTFGGDVYAGTAEGLQNAIASGASEIALVDDVKVDEVLLIDSDVVINGNGNTLTTSATRGFRVTTSDVNVTLNDVVIETSAVGAYNNDARGISVDGYLSGVTVTLNNCTVDFADGAAADWAYGVNISGSTTNSTIIINGGYYEGANVINVWGTGNTVVIDGATLNCTYGYNAQYHGAGIRLNTGCTADITVKNTTFEGTDAVAFCACDVTEGTYTYTAENIVDNTVSQ